MRRTKKLNLFLLLILLLFIISCEKNENGFYTNGPFSGKHNKTLSQWSDTGINYYTNTIFDSLGFDQNGFDKNGYNNVGFDKSGYDKNGFNSYGFNKKGFDKNGFNSSGYDKDGFNKDGYNIKGFNRRGIHKITKSRFDQYGYNVKGKKNAFEKKYFVDNFGDPTDKKYIIQSIDGIFSNSATDNSPAFVELIYTGGNKLRFDMHEYNQRNKAHYSSYERYKIRLKSDSGKTLDDELSIETSLKGCLILYNKKAVEMIKKANDIKVYIYEVDDDYPWKKLDTNYSFIIDCTGFIDSKSYLN